MSAEHTTGEIYERGVELRARAVLLLGGSARLGSELGSSTEISFNLGRGEYSDEQGPRSLSLDLQTRGTFSIKRLKANELSKNAYDVLALKNMSHGDFSAEGGVQLTGRTVHMGGRATRVVYLPITAETQEKHLQLMDEDLDLVETILENQ